MVSIIEHTSLRSLNVDQDICRLKERFSIVVILDEFSQGITLSFSKSTETSFGCQTVNLGYQE